MKRCKKAPTRHTCHAASANVASPHAHNERAKTKPQSCSIMGKIAPVPAQPQGLAKDMWVGEPPPKPAAPSWWGMYADFKGCDGCCFGCFCMPCAHGEVMEWATDEPGSACRHCITNVCCTYVFPCFAPLYIPWAIADARSKSEEKIWKFHNARSGEWHRSTCLASPTLPRC